MVLAASISTPLAVTSPLAPERTDMVVVVAVVAVAVFVVV